MKEILLTIFGTIGGVIAMLFGGWDAALTTLCIFMCIDYFTGLAVALIFHKSPKSKNGAYESKAGWKGLCRKGTSLLVIVIAHRLDILTGTTLIRDGTIIAYIINESFSIIENAGLMGIPMPAVITNAIDILKNKKDGDE